MAIELQTYRPRPIKPFGIECIGDWRLKRYGIAYGRELPRPELVSAALAAAEAQLPRPAQTETRYGVGFLGVHDGRDGNFVFVDWWGDETDLHHCVFFSSSDRPAELRKALRAEPIACVWDLVLLAHERAAWVKHVLARSEGPDLDAYLADQLEARI